MGKKRKSIATRLDEVDRTMFASFSTAANSLSQLYTQGMNHQKLSFQAGERHALEKLYQWVFRQQEGGSRVSTVDILNYIQHEMEYCGDDSSLPARLPAQNQVQSSGFPAPAGSSLLRSEQCETQPKNSVFSNALSSPVRRSLQNYHVAQSSGLTTGNGSCVNEPNFPQNQNRDSNPPSSNDSLMDMHDDSPAHDSNY